MGYGLAGKQGSNWIRLMANGSLSFSPSSHKGTNGDNYDIIMFSTNYQTSNVDKRLWCWVLSQL